MYCYRVCAGQVLMNWRLEDAFPGVQLRSVHVDIAALPLQRPDADAGARVSFLETGVGTAALVLAQHARAPTDATAEKASTAAALVRDALQIALDEEIEDEFPRPAVCLKLAFPPRIDPETVLEDTMDSVNTSALEVICDEKEMYAFVRSLMPALHSRGFADRHGGDT